MTTTCTTYYQHFDFSTSGALTHRYYVQKITKFITL